MIYDMSDLAAISLCCSIPDRLQIVSYFLELNLRAVFLCENANISKPCLLKTGVWKCFTSGGANLQSFFLNKTLDSFQVVYKAHVVSVIPIRQGKISSDIAAR